MWCTKYVFCYTELFRHGSPACQTGGQNYNSISKVSLCELKWRATVITMIHRKTILPGNPFKPADCLCVTGTPSSFKPTMYNESPPCTMTAHHVQWQSTMYNAYHTTNQCYTAEQVGYESLSFSGVLLYTVCYSFNSISLSDTLSNVLIWISCQCKYWRLQHVNFPVGR